MWIFSEAGGLFFFFLSARSLGIHKAKSTSAFFLSEAAANRNGFQEWNSLIATHLSLSISLCVGVLVHESAVVFFLSLLGPSQMARGGDGMLLEGEGDDKLSYSTVSL